MFPRFLGAMSGNPPVSDPSGFGTLMSIPPHWYARRSHLTRNLVSCHLMVLYTRPRRRSHPSTCGSPMELPPTIFVPGKIHEWKKDVKSKNLRGNHPNAKPWKITKNSRNCRLPLRSKKNYTYIWQSVHCLDLNRSPSIKPPGPFSSTL